MRPYIPKGRAKERALLIPIVLILESLAPSKVVMEAGYEEAVVGRDLEVAISLPLV
jgi:hypothetical protein